LTTKWDTTIIWKERYVIAKNMKLQISALTVLAQGFGKKLGQFNIKFSNIFWLSTTNSKSDLAAVSFFYEYFKNLGIFWGWC
jgi:uncharacterized protein YdgA (DUF945 family)